MSRLIYLFQGTIQIPLFPVFHGKKKSGKHRTWEVGRVGVVVRFQRSYLQYKTNFNITTIIHRTAGIEPRFGSKASDANTAVCCLFQPFYMIFVKYCQCPQILKEYPVLLEHWSLHSVADWVCWEAQSAMEIGIQEAY